MVFLGIVLCGVAVIMEICAFIAWIYILVHTFREYELWIGILSLLTPFFIYVAYDAFEGKKRWFLLGISVASHVLSLPLLIQGLSFIAGG